jgi:Fe-S-cluster containining protein
MPLDTGFAIACRPRCAACCIAPSISSAIPGLPDGKPAGMACVQLDEQLRCRLFDRADRPAVCARLRPSREMCRDTRWQALRWLATIERQTRPDTK